MATKEIPYKRLNLAIPRAEGWWPDLEDLYTCFNRLDGEVDLPQAP